MSVTERAQPVVTGRNESPNVCDAPAQILGVDGPLTLGRCFLGTGHTGPHAAPVERMTWGETEAAARG